MCISLNPINSPATKKHKSVKPDLCITETWIFKIFVKGDIN